MLRCVLVDHPLFPACTFISECRLSEFFRTCKYTRLAYTTATMSIIDEYSLLSLAISHPPPTVDENTRVGHRQDVTLARCKYTRGRKRKTEKREGDGG